MNKDMRLNVNVVLNGANSMQYFHIHLLNLLTNECITLPWYFRYLLPSCHRSNLLCMQIAQFANQVEVSFKTFNCTWRFSGGPQLYCPCKDV